MVPALTRTFVVGGIPLIHVVTKLPSGSSVGLGGPRLLSRGHHFLFRQAFVNGGCRPPWAWAYGPGASPWFMESPVCPLGGRWTTSHCAPAP